MGGLGEDLGRLGRPGEAMVCLGEPPSSKQAGTNVATQCESSKPNKQHEAVVAANMNHSHVFES